MDELYVECFSEPEEDWLLVPLETLITLFTIKYCFDSTIPIILVVRKGSVPMFHVKISGFQYTLLLDTDQMPEAAKACLLPVVLIEEHTCVAGLCGVLRQLIKGVLAVEPTHTCQSLLGFRQGCLLACAESSIWTRFCEVDIIQTVKNLMNEEVDPTEFIIPKNVARFEAHMAQPIRMHNVKKVAQDMRKKKGKENDKDEGSEEVLEHCFAEGPSMTLADVILFPCLHIIIELIRSSALGEYIPLTLKWYGHLLHQEDVKDCLSIIKEVTCKVPDAYVRYKMPEVPLQSLYKSDPRRYKPRNRIFTRQEDVETSLLVADALALPSDVYEEPFGSEVQFDWALLPFEAQTEGGHLPPSRCQRKRHQLENLTKAVLKVACPGHTIVDFCSGSGHLGIVLAYLLPHCHVILLENKEESLSRARARVGKMKLSNVSFCQCNLDYFVAKFNIGTSLHACGVATDLVIQCCIQKRAVFVCCPCCYGAVQNNHIITYPRSQFFRNSAMTLREYLVLGHSADQTHDENNVKTDQGKKCMGIIDKDRCLQASEAGYVVSLAKLIPQNCTPKNNLLVGIPKEWNLSPGK